MIVTEEKLIIFLLNIDFYHVKWFYNFKIPFIIIKFLAVSTKNASICDNTVLNLTSGAYGVMTSPGYPVFQSGVNCQRQIIAPVGRFIRVYMNDLGMGEVDDNGQ